MGTGMAVAMETVRIISDVGRGSVWCGGMTGHVTEPHRRSSACNPPGRDELTLNVSMGATSAGRILPHADDKTLFHSRELEHPGDG